MTVLDVLTADRALSVVRADGFQDVADLCRALVAGGIRVVELTFTTPDLARHLRRAAETVDEHGAVLGAGTVLTLDQACQAIEAGARFLVTPGVVPDSDRICTVAHEADVPVALGAMTPSEVVAALAAGADIVKIFPASRLGPGYLKDLLGPLPGTTLLPSGGITAENARDYLAAGALAVCAGSGVVSAADIARGDFEAITGKARAFREALGSTPS